VVCIVDPRKRMEEGWKMEEEGWKMEEEGWKMEEEEGNYILIKIGLHRI
jgi:hypothetical protein